MLKLAQNLPQLWYNSSTAWKDKKRILQMLIADITVQKPQPRVAILQLRWQGGLCEEIRVELPRPIADQWRHDPALIERVRELAIALDDAQIAARLNEKDLRRTKETHSPLRASSGFATSTTSPLSMIGRPENSR